MGTTSEKLTYLNTTKTLIKEELNLGGANITNEPFRQYKSKLEGIYKDFLANGTDTLWNNWEKVSGIGETLSLTPTIKGRIQSTLKGNTYQYTTTGKQLFDYTALTQQQYITIDGEYITITNNSGDMIYQVISFTTPLVAGAYTVKLDVKSITSGKTVFLYIQDDITSYDSTHTLTVNMSSATTHVSSKTFGDTVKRCMLTIPAGATIKLSAMLVSGTYTSQTMPQWEQYTGNQPSPNPDYPQDIQVVSGDNSIKVEGKNIFDISKITAFYNASYTALSTAGTISNGIITSNFGFAGDKRFIYDSAMKLEGGTYTLSAYVKANKSSGDKQARLGIYKKSGITYISGKTTTLANYNEEERLSLTFTLEEQTEIIIQLQSVGGGGVYNDLNIQFRNVQLEKGDQATTYTPYVSQTYPISLGNIELCKIGTYQDSIVKDNGKWYLNKQIGKVVLDGSENWNNDYGTYLFGFPSALNDYPPIIGYGLSNYYKYNSVQSGIDTNTNNGDFAIQQSASNIYNLFFKNTSINGVENFKTWLSNNNTTVYYPLATPTNTEITDSTLKGQLNNLYNANSYEGTTNVSQVNDDMPFILDLTCLKEMS